MATNDDFYGKELNLNCFYMHTNFEQKYPKTAVVPTPLPDESINVRLKRSRICQFLTTLPTPINDYVIHGWTLTTSAELPQ